MSSISAHALIKAVVIPAAVFQSVIFGGAYGTGREIAEFMGSHGPWGGLFALTIVAACFALVLSLCFDLARQFRVYDYRRFLKLLVGPGWVAFELLFLVALVLVLAVNGSAAGTIIEDRLGISAQAGVGLLFVAVVLLNFLGRRWLEQSMTICMMVLVMVLVVFCVMTFGQKGHAVAQTFAQQPTTGRWAISGLQYALYNVAVVPILLFCVREIPTRRMAWIAGTIAGLVGAFPALIFHVTFMSDYPAVLAQPLPTYWLIDQLQAGWLLAVYLVVLFAMIVQTVAGLLHGLNERLDGWSEELRGRPCGALVHAMVAAVALIVSFVLAKFGIVALVAKGYGNLAWGYLLVFVIPLITVGVRRLGADRPPAD